MNIEVKATEAENNRFYIDLEGGLRLVVFEGKIDGWYFPGEKNPVEEYLKKELEYIKKYCKDEENGWDTID